MNHSTNARVLHGALIRGELDATGLEALARQHAGFDSGNPRPLTEEEREYMARDAYQCDPAYPYEQGITLDDKSLCRWWLRAMQDYVDSMF